MALKDFVEIEVSKLMKAPWNYKRDDDEEEIEKRKQALLNNFKENGQLENLIVRKMDGGKYEVVNGNHRLDVVNQLKFDSVICYDLGKVSEARARFIAAQTNETKFPRDEVKFSQLLNYITKEIPLDDVLKNMPMSKEEMDDILKLQDFSFDKYQEENEEAKKEQNSEKKLLSFTLTHEVADMVYQQLLRFMGKLNCTKEKALEYIMLEIGNIPDSQLFHPEDVTIEE